MSDMTTVTKKQGLLGRLALIATTLIWGTSFVVLKNALDYIPTLYILAIRFTGAAIMMALVGFRELKKLDWATVKYGTVIGVLLFAAYVVQTYGLVYTTPGKNSFLTAVYCVLVPFVAWLLYKKKPDSFNIIAAVVGFAGVGLVSLDSTGGINKGDVLTLCCGVFYALHIVFVERHVAGRSVILITMMQFATAGVLSWIGALCFEAAPGAIPAEVWVRIAYLCIVCTGMCFFLQILGQKYTPASAAALLLTLESVFGTLFSVIFYKEKLTLNLILGFAMIFVAVVISETKLSFLIKPKKEKNS